VLFVNKNYVLLQPFRTPTSCRTSFFGPAQKCVMLINKSHFGMSYDSFAPFVLCEIVLPNVIGTYTSSGW
jgi:hypothetical protein